MDFLSLNNFSALAAMRSIRNTKSILSMLKKIKVFPDEPMAYASWTLIGKTAQGKLFNYLPYGPQRICRMAIKVLRRPVSVNGFQAEACFHCFIPHPQ